MNHVYRTVFNRALGAWQAVAETARNHAAGSLKRDRAQVARGAAMRLGTVALALQALSPAGQAQTLPTGGTVMRGQASILPSASGLTVSQQSRNAVIHWDSFSVGNGATVHFDNGTGATLNRVTGKLPSHIDGTLTATGSLYLVNQNGVVVGPGGIINAGGFMATTLDVRDDEFMAGGGLRFWGSSRASVVNLGSIRADSGNVALVAHSVHNAGEIRAPRGSAELLAANEVFLASPESPALLVSLPGEGGTGTGASNTGLIEAAQARLQAADGNLYALAINQSGVIRATGTATLDGRIVLTAEGGTVQQDGKLSARNADGSGGTLLVGGDLHGGNTAVANAGRTVVTANAQMDASASGAQGNGGRVVVWANDSTSFAGRIAARAGSAGGDGGFVEVSGKHTLDFRPTAPIDLSAPAGKAGTVLLDPNRIEVVDTVTGVNQIAAATVQSGLASANYVLDTSNFDPTAGNGDIAVNSALSWAGASTLTLKSGNAVQLNADITAPDGTLDVQAGRFAERPPETDLPYVMGGATLAAGKTLRVNTLRYGANPDSLPAGYTPNPPAGTGLFLADGTLRVNTLELDLGGGRTGFIAEGAGNAIGAFRTTGSGDMGFVSIVDQEGDLRVRLQSTGSSGNGAFFVTPGNLTLESGSRLSYDDTGYVRDVVFASTADNFINEAGSSALGDNSRFLIYSGTAAATVKGGLAGTEEYSRSHAGNPPQDYAGDTTSRFLFRQAAAMPELTYRADNLSRAYGDANPGLSYSVSGLLTGDVLSSVVSGAPLLSTSATLRSGVGTYSIDISQGSLASSSYGFRFVPGLLTVNAAPLTLDIASASRYYGAENPALAVAVSGLKAGDTEADILAGWRLSTSATRDSNVGGYAIDATWLGTGSTNYTYTVNPGTLTIRPTPVTLTLDPTSSVYGNALPDFRALASLSGTYNGDTVATAFPTATFSTAASPASSVGTYAVTVTGFANPNYQLTIGPLGDLTIGKATLVVNASNAHRLYGDADPAFGVASISGFRNGDTLASIPGLVLGSPASAASPVGSYPIVPSGSAENYEFVAGTGTLTIGKAPLVVRLQSASRLYGDVNPDFAIAYEGLKNGETGLAGLSVTSSANVRSPVGAYPLLASAPDAQNYDVTYYGAALTVQPRPLTVSANAVARLYGADNPLLSVAVENATAWDAAQAASYWTAATTATQRSDVGSYPVTVSANPYGDRFDNLGNYAVTLQPGTLSVTRAPVTVVAQPLSIIWGDGRPPIDYVLEGLMPWDSAATAGTVLLTSVAGGTNAAPGRYAITLVDTAVGANYQAVLHGSPFIDVQRRPITITGSYRAPMEQLQNLFPGQIEPFMVKRYDSSGNLMMYTSTAPLAGGPQFSVMASSDKTRGEGLGVYVSNAFIEPAAGSSLEDVLRYYDPVSKPGVAQATTLFTQNIVLNKITLPPAMEVVVDKPPVIQTKLRDQTESGNAPSLRNLVQDAFPDVATMMREIRALFDQARGTGPQADAANRLLDRLPPVLKQELIDARANESVWQYYKQLAADTEQWMADLARERPRPAHYDALMASAQADLRDIRAKMAKMPSFEKLHRDLLSGDPMLVQHFLPLMSKSLLKAHQEGKLAPDTEAALVRLINEQRAKTIAATDAKYQAIMGKERGITGIVSAPQIPDIVGQAYVDAAADQMARAQLGAGVGAAALAGGAVAAATLGAATMTWAGTSYSLINAVGVLVTAADGTTKVLSAGAGGAAAVAAPAIVAAVAITIGVTEAVQVAESTKNYERYMSYRAANRPLTSLDGFDMSKSDNMMQMITALGALMTESVGKAMP